MAPEFRVLLCARSFDTFFLFEHHQPEPIRQDGGALLERFFALEAQTGAKPVVEYFIAFTFLHKTPLPDSSSPPLDVGQTQKKYSDTNRLP